MVAYIKLDPEEEIAIKRAISRALATSDTFQDTGKRVSKLKKSKKYAARGLTKAMKDIDLEISKIKEALPELEKKELKPSILKKGVKTKKKEKIEKKKTKIKKTAKKKQKLKKKRKKTKQEIELEKLRERIYKL